MRIAVQAIAATASETREAIAAVRAALAKAAHRIVRVVVTLSGDATKKQVTRRCVIEVHMDDGHVELVEERQRRLGAALRRAADRAWAGVAQWIRHTGDTHAAQSHPQLAPAGTGSGRTGA